MTQDDSTRPPNVWLLCVTITYATVCGLIFTPGLPDLAKHFQINPGMARLPVTTFLAGYAAGQLLYGPLGNGIGRRNTIYTGIGVSLCGALLCLTAIAVNSFPFLVAAVFVVALGSCVGLVMTFTIIADFFPPEKARKILSFTMASFAVVPGLAVAAGGLLTTHFGWKSTFYFIVAYAGFVALMARRLPEKHTSYDIHAVKPKRIIENYLKVAKSKTLIAYSCILGGITSITYTFLSTAPFIATQYLDMTPAQYGGWNMVVVAGVLTGYVLAAKTAGLLETNTILMRGLSLSLTCGLAMLALFATGHASAITTFVLMALIQMGTAFMTPCSSAAATTALTDKANGSAVMTFSYMSLTVLGVLILGLFPSVTPLQLPAAVVIYLSGILLLLMTGAHHPNQKNKSGK